jgi:hypothetical protein
MFDIAPSMGLQRRQAISAVVWKQLSPPVSPASASTYLSHELLLLLRPAMDLHLAPIHSKSHDQLQCS